MYAQSKAIVAIFFALLFLVAAGCGKSGDSSKTTQAGSETVPASAATASIPSGATTEKLQHPVVVVDTSMGAITIKLDREKAQLTVDNFLAYVQGGHYDQSIIHQVFRGQGVLGGGYGLDLTEKPTRTEIRNEAHNGLKNVRGSIAMIRSADAIDSARSQFFLNVSDNEGLDHQDRTLEGYGYCVFGQIIAGMEVLDKISETPVQDTPQFERTPSKPIIVKSVRLSR